METINLREERRALGLKQEEMAEKLGISQSALSRMEAGIIAVNRRTELAIKALRQNVS